MDRLPSWFHKKIPPQGDFAHLLHHYNLPTVCQEACCPNSLSCFSQRRATFLALGKHCTRHCGFCAIAFSSKPAPPDPEEPKKIAICIEKLKLKQVILTMPSRDDLEDGGARSIAAILNEVKKKTPLVEILASDFEGNRKALTIVLQEKPLIFAHNVETVASLTPNIRHKASYERSLSLLKYAKESLLVPWVKSGIMVGLGEKEEEVKETLKDLYQAGVSAVTIGQYLKPRKDKLPIASFISPKQFKKYEDYGLSIGIQKMFSGPFIRSSSVDLATYL